MKYLKQFFIIIVISCIGEILKTILPFPIPASIYGMVLMLICLMTGILKLDDVKDVGSFLVEIMPVMFIPAGVGLIASWDVLRPVIIPVGIITVVAIITVMFATGHVTQFIINHTKPSKEENVDE